MALSVVILAEPKHNAAEFSLTNLYSNHAWDATGRVIDSNKYEDEELKIKVQRFSLQVSPMHFCWQPFWQYKFK